MGQTPWEERSHGPKHRVFDQRDPILQTFDLRDTDLGAWSSPGGTVAAGNDRRGGAGNAGR
ncbi:MAG: hypothetical protein KDK99_09375, partial [Verrucomicrobiales bacterium]|nr:hypothetical protein [Verrucomicrobiales bacterium]